MPPSRPHERSRLKRLREGVGLGCAEEPESPRRQRTGRSAMETIHYTRCRMVPTTSSLAFQLGLLQQETAALAAGEVKLAIGDYDHHDDRLWLRHAGTSKPL